MSFPFDPEFFEATKVMAEHPPPKLEIGDIASRRAGIKAVFGIMMALRTPRPEIKRSVIQIPTKDNATVPLHIYTPPSLVPQSPAILLVHGGGYISGSPEINDAHFADVAHETKLPVFAVDYRKAPEHPYPTPLNDVYAAAEYLISHAAELDIDAHRIAVYGQSAGGGLGMALLLLARDRGLQPALRGAVLAYPMVDDRTRTIVPKGMTGKLIWTPEDNITGWSAYLGAKYGTDDVEGYAAPARAEDLTRLPPVYIDVGALDLFVSEDVELASKLIKAGNEVEFHLFHGVPHGWEVAAPHVSISKEAEGLRHAALLRFVGAL